MRTLLAMLLTCALVTVMAGDADAKSRKKKKQYRSYDAPYSQSRDRTLYGGRNDGTYFERVLDKVPFGSPRWWEIYHERNLPRG